MSRSGYHDDCSGSQEEQWATIRWRGAVKSAVRGKRGQAFIRRALKALDAMGTAELASHTFEADGKYCLLGAVAKHEGIDLTEINEDYDEEWGDDGEGAENLAVDLNIAQAMAREIVWENDECYVGSDNRRFEYMRGWLIANLDGDL